MKLSKLFLSGALAAALLLGALAGCNAADTTSTSETGSEAGANATGILADSYLDENGFWIGIKALEHVTLLDYKALPIPADVHTISDEQIQAEIDYMLSYYANTVEVTDRAVEDGDTVNIDYVGSVDGVEFSGGSTGGMGTDVTIGVTPYIDNFLEQLVGHEPGENFDINVTFPADYGVDELDGADAIFNITINYIVETAAAELTDEFVAENFGASYGFATVAELRADMYDSLQANAIQEYVYNTLVSGFAVSNIPDKLMEYLETSMVEFYEEYATAYGMELDDFLASSLGVASVEALKEEFYDDNLETAAYYLAVQAIAEDADMLVGNDEIEAYFMEYVGTADYSSYEADYGLPYIKQVVLCQNVLDYVVENAILA